MSTETLIQMQQLSEYLTNLESELSQFWQLNAALLCIFEGDKLIKVNPAWTKVLGYDKMELLEDHNLYSLVEDSLVKFAQKNIKKLILNALFSTVGDLRRVFATSQICLCCRCGPYLVGILKYVSMTGSSNYNTTTLLYIKFFF